MKLYRAFLYLLAPLAVATAAYAATDFVVIEDGKVKQITTEQAKELLKQDDTTPPVEPDDSEFVPDGYVKTWSQEFNAPTKVIDLTAAKAGDELISGFWQWNVRHLQGNNDKAGKTVTVETHLLNSDSTALLIRALNKPLTAQLRGGTTRTYQFTAGMISTELGHVQRLGYFEFRMRTKISKGDHVAGWLLRKDGVYNKAAVLSEIDMVELVGGDDTFYFNDHGPGVGPMTKVAGNGTTDEWNTYGLLLTETGSIWYLNGKEVRRSSKPMATDVYWLLTHETGGNWPGMPNNTTVWPQEVEIDYVRIYKLQ